MKKLFLLVFLTASFIFLSCSSFEEDHKMKKGVRNYLNETLHDPESLEEIRWTIREGYELIYDTVTSSIMIDRRATYHKKDSLNSTYHIRLQYRANNGYGALRKSEIFAIYYEKAELMIFEEIAYSYKLESFFGEETNKFMKPRRLYLQNDFFRKNEGQASMKDFHKEYPEFD